MPKEDEERPKEEGRGYTLSRMVKSEAMQDPLLPLKTLNFHAKHFPTRLCYHKEMKLSQATVLKVMPENSRWTFLKDRAH